MFYHLILTKILWKRLGKWKHIFFIVEKWRARRKYLPEDTWETIIGDSHPHQWLQKGSFITIHLVELENTVFSFFPDTIHIMYYLRYIVFNSISSSNISAGFLKLMFIVKKESSLSYPELFSTILSNLMVWY